ncbi:MAG: hypothetical protein KBI47_08760 [Armatimonadetes bacterium]|nr:hypothetical protein [Armatimonadota bacterium]
MEDHVFYESDGISVTSTLVTLMGGKTYATANITSVSTEKVTPPPRSVGCQIILIIIGALGVLGAFGVMGGDVGSGFGALVVSGGVLAGGIFWLKATKTPQPTYVLKIASASGEAEGMRSSDRQLIADVSSAIMKAIAARG